jgi:hypothetical protein
MSTHEEDFALASRSDRELRELAMRLAPGLREHCAECNGPGAADEDIATGLLIRAAASAIVRYCHSIEEAIAVTRILQGDLADKVSDLLVEGRPFGRLHS